MAFIEWCAAPAVMTVAGTCLCGTHPFRRLSCEEHADPDGPQVCGACAEAGHWCPCTLGPVP